MIRPATRLAALPLAVVLSVAAMLLAGSADAQPLPQPSAGHLAVAREVAVLSGLTRSFDAILPQFAEQVRKQVVTRPELTKDLDEVLDGLKPELELQKQQMTTTAARILASQMTEQELKDVSAFFKSPSGQKYVQTQPYVLDTLVTEMQNWTQQVSEYVMTRVRAEMGKRGHQMQ